MQPGFHQAFRAPAHPEEKLKANCRPRKYPDPIEHVGRVNQIALGGGIVPKRRSGDGFYSLGCTRNIFWPIHRQELTGDSIYFLYPVMHECFIPQEGSRKIARELNSASSRWRSQVRYPYVRENPLRCRSDLATSTGFLKGRTATGLTSSSLSTCVQTGTNLQMRGSLTNKRQLEP